MKKKIKAVLFDLDGTLVDTAPDLGYAINLLRAEHHLPPLPLHIIRPEASKGARGLLKISFNITPDDEQFESLKNRFFDLYLENICLGSRLFTGMEEVLTNLENASIPWGVVTNKIERFTIALLKRLDLFDRAACVISGDTCAHAKPHPAPLLEASKRLNLTAPECIYVGDDLRDVQAAAAANMPVIVAKYGYLGGESAPETWGATHLIDTPQELLSFL